MSLSAYKTTSERSTTSALDLLGDVGGFHQAFDLTVFIIGQWFSFKFFFQTVANTFYLLRSHDDKSSDDEQLEGGDLYGSEVDDAASPSNIMAKPKTGGFR